MSSSLLALFSSLMLSVILADGHNWRFVWTVVFCQELFILSGAVIVLLVVVLSISKR
jgi:hypothetical protein